MAKKKVVDLKEEQQEEILDKKGLLDLSRFLLILKRCVDLGTVPNDKLEEGFDIYRLNINMIEDMETLLFDEVVANNSRLNPLYAKFRQAKKTFDLDSLNSRVPLIEGCFKHLHLNPTEILSFGENEPLLINYIKDLNLGILEKKTLDSLKVLINIPSFLLLKSGAKSPQKWLSSLILDNVTNSTKTEQIDQMLAVNQSYVNVANDIKNMDTQLRSLNPNTSDFKELSEKRKSLLQKLINEVQENEGNEAKTILISLTNSIHSSETHITETGKRLKLTPEQEKAMIVTGKSIISAGAGSGKTRVLAGRIAWLIQEHNVPSSSIMATSFTGNSATELIERIEKPEFAGAGSVKGYGFGTSHSIGNGILLRNSNKYRFPDYNLDGKLIELALKQVQMVADRGANIGKMENKPLFNQYTENDINNYVAMINTFTGYANHFLNQPSTPPAEKEELKKDILLLNAITSGRLLPYDLSKEQKNQLNDMIASDRGKKVFGKLINQDKLVDLDRLQKISSDKKAQDDEELRIKGQKNQKGPPPKNSPFYKKAANMWFNLGINDEQINSQAYQLRMNKLFKEADELEEGYEEFRKKKDAGFFKKEVSKAYNDIMSVKQLKDSLRPSFLNNILVAVYGAFLWLKENDLTYRGFYSADDMLIKTIGLMIEKPSLLSSLQNEFKHIMVDEAQDLNKSQHIFFGLIAGTINPGNLLPYTDGRPMRAKSFVLIGDDKQAIYEFRGASPQTFIEKSNFFGGDFETAIIPTNFRSGSQIVDAANQLISYNTQIPMTCVSVPSKGEGNIYYERSEDPSFGYDALKLMSEVKTHLSLGGKSEDYGVATRSKAEAYPFLLEALKNKIPFRSQTNPLSKQNFKAVLKWLEFISLSDSQVNEINQLVLELHSLGLVFFLGEKTFTEPATEILQQNKNINLLTDMPLEKFPLRVANISVRSNVENYLKVLKKARKINGSTESCFQQLLDLKDLKDGGRKFAEVLFPTGGDSVGSEEEDEEKEDVSTDYQIMTSLLTFDDKKIVTLADTIKELKSYMKAVKDASEAKKGMLIDTMHQWKGLECKFLTTIFSSRFPRRKDDDQTEEEYQAQIQSERRLAYVAMTRGQDNVRILSNRTIRIWDSATGTWKFKVVEPSQFISEGCIKEKYSKLSEKTSSENMPAEDFLNSLVFRK